MTLKTQQMPGEPAAPAVARRSLSSAEASRQLETLLRQYVDRLNETGQASGARELQNRLSAMTQSHAVTSAARKMAEPQPAPVPNPAAAVENRWAEFATYFGQSRQTRAVPAAPAQPEPVSDAAAVTAPPSQPRPAPRPGDAASAPLPTAQPHWLEQRLSDLETLLALRPAITPAELDRRFDEILTRLDQIQNAAAAPSATLTAMDRTLTTMQAEMRASASQQNAQSEVLLQIGRTADRLDQVTQDTRAAIGKAADITAAAVTKAAERTEKAAIAAADAASRRTFEVTARHMTEALRQASPASRFAAIETEVRALNHQSRETGQRAARALEEVHSTLKQFLSRVAEGETARAAPAPASAATQAEAWPEAWGNLPAWQKPAPEPQYPWEKQAAAKAVARQNQTADASGHEDDDTNGRRLKVGLAVAAVILLIASAGMLYLNVTGKRPPLPAAASPKAASITATPALAAPEGVIAVFTVEPASVSGSDAPDARWTIGWTAALQPALPDTATAPAPAPAGWSTAIEPATASAGKARHADVRPPLPPARRPG